MNLQCINLFFISIPFLLLIILLNFNLQKYIDSFYFKFFRIMTKKLCFIFSFLVSICVMQAQPPCPPNVTLSFQNTPVSCFGGNNGTATVTVNGGSNNYAYSWTPTGGNSFTASGLTAGVYTCTVLNTTTTGGGVPTVVYSENFNGATSTLTLNTPTGLNDLDANFWEVTDDESGVLPPGCGAAGLGNPTLHVTNTLVANAGASYNAGGLCALGICVTTNVRAETPNISTIGFTGLTLTFNYIGNGQGTIDNASLVYSTNGGGTWTVLAPSLKSPICTSGQGQWTAASYTLPAACNGIPNLRIGFVWTNNDDGVGSDPSFAVDDIQIVSGGTTTSVCAVTGSVTITQPATAISATINTVPLGCNGSAGSLTAIGSGGTGPYSYSWNNGQVTPVLANLSTGTYTCYVKDANNCTTQVSATLNPPQGLAATSSTLPSPCFGINTGTATALVTSGTAPYTYSWSNGQSAATISGLAAGVYTCIIHDANSCTATITAVVQGPTTPLSIAFTSQNPGCTGNADGAITANGLGGTPNYSYSWSNGISGQTISNLGPGVYTCFITDAANCTNQQSVTLIQASGLSTATSSTPSSVAASTGTATVTVSGGTAPYSYTWNTVPAQYTSTAIGLPPGVYTCTIKDANGCVRVVTVTIENGVGIDNQTMGLASYQVTPNPTTDFIWVHTLLIQKDDIRISLFDINGQEVFEQKESNILELNQVIPMSSFSAGVYLLKIETSKGQLIDKVIKY